jgi:Leucine-rich repeat (LRR) protein
MSKIEAEVKQMAGEEGSEIDPLDFDNLDLTDVEIGTLSPEDKVYLEKFTKVDNMIMLGCGLTSLENFPDLPELKRLELSENEFKGSDLVHLQKLKGLICLNLNGNKIDTMAELAHLKDLPLTTLEVTGNPVSELEDF